MVTPLHEGLVGIATLDPGHTAHMLEALFTDRLHIPAGNGGQVVTCSLSECVPAEYRADGALLYGADDDQLAVVTEVQLKRDPLKHETWLAYIANMRARYHCDACLIVICPNTTIARWAAEPIITGHPGLILTPLVIGPENTPVITDVAVAMGNIGLAAISAITHGQDPEIQTILATLTTALNSIDPSMAARYAEYVTVALTGDAQKEMERLMATKSYLYQGEYAQSISVAAEARGEAKAVIKILQARGIPVTDQQQERIQACSDADTLDRWVKRVISVTTADELFT
ncbi:hypothetical protein ACIBEJ_49010 [Nonomuraea sp. NPDC050790]|uniref:hypothetical protein n=1 Tax=Nonomuraea sp. NPDC050790 TaxID=3364371 RepID=UPI0037A0D957